MRMIKDLGLLSVLLLPLVLASCDLPYQPLEGLWASFDYTGSQSGHFYINGIIVDSSSTATMWVGGWSKHVELFITNKLDSGRVDAAIFHLISPDTIENGQVFSSDDSTLKLEATVGLATPAKIGREGAYEFLDSGVYHAEHLKVRLIRYRNVFLQHITSAEDIPEVNAAIAGTMINARGERITITNGEWRMGRP